MAIDEVPEQGTHFTNPPENTHKCTFIALFVILAALAIGEIYTLSQMNSLQSSFQADQDKLRKELGSQIDQQFSTKVMALENSNARQLDGLRQELDSASKRMGATGRDLRKARTMVQQLQTEQSQQAEAIRQELAQKADQQQLSAVTQDVSMTKSDLDTTKKNVQTIATDLGMARSELGTLIARNHQDIEYLRKIGDRDYFEFTLKRKRTERVAGVGLELLKTNTRRHRFNINIVADDMAVERKDRTINEPVFFYLKGSKRPFELVVNQVTSDSVKGYVSTPKGATEVAAATSAPEGTQPQASQQK